MQEPAEMLRSLHTRGRREDGIAMVFAIQVLSILTLMIAATMGATLSLQGSTERDFASKRALAAAMSGLDVARYRVNKVSPGNSMCVTDRAVAPGTPPAPPGQCPAFSGDLGNGVTYAYRVGTAPPNSTCAGQSIPPGNASNSRCIT